MAVRQCPNGTGSHLRSVHRLRQVQCVRGAHEWNTRTFWPAPAKNVRAHAPRRKRSLWAIGAESGFESRPRSPKSESDSQWCPALSDGSRLQVATPPAARAARKIRSHWQGAGTLIPDPRVVPDLPRRERGPRPGRPPSRRPDPDPDPDSEMAAGPGREWSLCPMHVGPPALRAGSRWGRVWDPGTSDMPITVTSAMSAPRRCQPDLCGHSLSTSTEARLNTRGQLEGPS